jgi:two-component system chemotaxis response regulator CheB
MSLIRVVAVDDSATAREMIGRILTGAADIQLVASAADGAQALELLRVHRPDVLLTDLEMPGVDGLTLVRQVMANCPLPILVVTASHHMRGGVFEMLAAGALDVLAKPRDGTDGEELLRKIRTLAGVPVFRRRSAPAKAGHRSVEARPSLIAIGASTGGPQVLEIILSTLPRSSPPVLLVQHMAPGFTPELVRWLQRLSPATVQLAEDGWIPRVGHVYVAPEGVHLSLDTRGRLRCATGPARHGHRPAVDETFEAVARVHGPRSWAILLSGMGRDGADGMARLQAAGARTIIQEAGSCVVFGMPRAAQESGSVSDCLSPAEIRDLLASC